jgi:hypothetical protein
MTNERPNVVAPRPVRLANSFFQRDDLKVSFYADIADIVDKRQSPERPWCVFHVPTLPFLSYLQCLQLCSPDRGLGRVLINSSPLFPAETPFSDYQTSPPFRCHFWPLQFRLPRPHNTTKCTGHTPWCTLVLFFSSMCVLNSLHFLYSHPMSLASPVSRMHTRNPFLRNSDNRSPARIAPLTPAAVPLPPPTPDELIDNNS